MTKMSKNLGLLEIRTEEIPNLEVNQILNYLADLSGFGRIVTEHPQMKIGKQNRS